MKWFKRFIKWCVNMRANDPVYSCKIYTQEGCSHVDGYLCDMKTCNILEGVR